MVRRPQWAFVRDASERPSCTPVDEAIWSWYAGVVVPIPTSWLLLAKMAFGKRVEVLVANLEFKVSVTVEVSAPPTTARPVPVRSVMRSEPRAKEPEMFWLVEVALVVVPFVAVKASKMPVVRRPRVAKSEVEVEFVVVAKPAYSEVEDSYDEEMPVEEA